MYGCIFTCIWMWGPEGQLWVSSSETRCISFETGFLTAWGSPISQYWWPSGLRSLLSPSLLGFHVRPIKSTFKCVLWGQTQVTPSHLPSTCFWERIIPSRHMKCMWTHLLSDSAAREQSIHLQSLQINFTQSVQSQTELMISSQIPCLFSLPVSKTCWSVVSHRALVLVLQLLIIGAASCRVMVRSHPSTETHHPSLQRMPPNHCFPPRNNSKEGKGMFYF